MNRAFILNVAPSLIVKGFLMRSSSAPRFVRSMIMSERPSTSRPKEKMMTLRGSLASERLSPVPRPRDSFHFLRDSSLASGVDHVNVVFNVGSMLNVGNFSLGVRMKLSWRIYYDRARQRGFAVTTETAYLAFGTHRSSSSRRPTRG